MCHFLHLRVNKPAALDELLEGQWHTSALHIAANIPQIVKRSYQLIIPSSEPLQKRGLEEAAP